MKWEINPYALSVCVESACCVTECLFSSVLAGSHFVCKVEQNPELHCYGKSHDYFWSSRAKLTVRNIHKISLFGNV